jgi:hypothetical protein
MNFGDRPIHGTARNNFAAEAAPDDDRPAPDVPQDTAFTEPQSTTRGFNDRTLQIITMPVGLIVLFNVSNENGEMLANVIQPPGDILRLIFPDAHGLLKRNCLWHNLAMKLRTTTETIFSCATVMTRVTQFQHPCR